MRHLQTFRVIATERSFTRAALKLNYAQSSVTAQIKLLEAEIGVPLFNRLGRRIELTSAGTQLCEYAERLLHLADEAKQAIVNGGPPSGTLNISASETLLSYRLPGLLKRYQSRYPAVKLTLGSSSSCVPGNLLTDNTDIAFTIDSQIKERHVISVTLRPERIKLAVSPSHFLAKQTRPSGPNLQSEQFLVTSSDCRYRRVFEHTLQQEGVDARKLLTFESVEAIKQCAIARMGVAVLPSVVIADEVRRGKLIALTWPRRSSQMTVFTQMFHHKDKWMSPALSAFWEMSQRMLREPKKPLAPCI